MEIPEWVSRLALALFGAVGGGILSVIVFTMRLGNRVTALETKVTLMDEYRRIEHNQTMAAIREVQAQATASSRAIAEAREDALRFFAEDSDLKRMEDKVDNLTKSIDALTANAIRRRARAAKT